MTNPGRQERFIDAFEIARRRYSLRLCGCGAIVRVIGRYFTSVSTISLKKPLTRKGGPFMEDDEY